MEKIVANIFQIWEIVTMGVRIIPSMIKNLINGENDVIRFLHT